MCGRSTRDRRRSRQPGQEGGYSLIEIMVSLAIICLVAGGAIIGLRSLVKTELRGAASKLAASIRYSYDRAISTGAFYRLHFNLDDQTYRLERSENRVLLSTKENGTSKGGRGEDRDIQARIEEEEERKTAGSNLPAELMPPPSPRRPKFAEYKDSSLPVIRLKKIHILDIYTPRQPEPFSAGHAYLHFFPDGHTERAIIHMGADPADSDQYSLIVHGLTGRVEIRAGRVPPPPDFEAGDSAVAP